MSRAKELTKSSISIIVSQIAIALISIIFIAYFARIFTLEQMAILAIMEMLTGWIQLTGSLGLGTLAVKDVALYISKNETGKAKQLLSSVALYRSSAIFVISVIVYFLGPVISDLTYNSGSYTALIRLATLIAFFASVQIVFSEIQTALQKFHTQSAINVGIILGQRALSVIGFFIYDIQGFLIGFLTAIILGVSVTVFDVRKHLTYKLIPFTEVFRKSRGYMGIDFLRGALDQVDRPIIAFLIGAEVLAGYYIAKRIYDQFHKLMQAITLPMGVKFGEVKTEGQESLTRYFNQCIRIISALFVPLGFYLILISESLIFLYAGEKYIFTVPVSMAFGFTIMSAAFWSVLRESSLRLISAGQLFYQYFVSALVTLTFYFVLLPTLNTLGIPLAIGLGYLLGTIPAIFFLKYKYNLTLPLKEISKSFVAGAGIILIMLFINIPNLYIQLAVYSLLSLLVYIIWLLALGPREIRSIIIKALSKLALIKKA